MRRLRADVYQISPRSVGVAFGGLGLVLLPAVFARRLIRKTGTGPPGAVNALDRLAIGRDNEIAEFLSNLGTGVGIAIPFVVDWFDTTDGQEFLVDALVIGQALALDGGLNTAVKYIIQRPLPETYAGEDKRHSGKPRGYRAFYSGHVSALATSLAAGCLTALFRHGRLPWRWPWLVSSVLTGLVGLGRIFAGKHFPTDVLVGAPVGAAIGAVIPLLHERRGRFTRAWAKLRRVRRWRAHARHVV